MHVQVLPNGVLYLSGGEVVRDPISQVDTRGAMSASLELTEKTVCGYPRVGEDGWLRP